jgi:hypothetical protein
MNSMACLNADVEQETKSSIELMTTLLSPTDCYYCRSNTNIQSYRFPCDCTIYAHPDCYKNYELDNRKLLSHKWQLACPKCNIRFTLPDVLQLQIQIPNDDDELRPLTRKELRREKYVVCAILSTQGILISGLIAACVYGYYTIIMGIV